MVRRSRATKPERSEVTASDDTERNSAVDELCKCRLNVGPKGVSETQGDGWESLEPG